MNCERSFFLDRIAIIKAQIILYEDALSALATGAQSYTIDTGQTRQTVTKFNLTELNNMLSSLYNRLATTVARAKGCGVTNLSAAF